MAIKDTIQFSSVYLASLLAHRRLAQAVIRAEGNMSSTEYGVLSLAERTSEFMPTRKAISNLLLLQPRTIQLAAENLVERGCLCKNASEIDRREVVFSRTLTGTTLLKRVQSRLVDEFERTLFAKIPRDERNAILPLIYEKVTLDGGRKASEQDVFQNASIPATFFAGISKTLRVYEQVLADNFDVTLSGFRLLDCLADEGAASLGDLAQYLRIQNSVVTLERAVLEPKGFLISTFPAEDQRSTNLKITKAGRVLTEQARAALSKTTRLVNGDIDSAMARRINAWHMRMYCDIDSVDHRVASLRKEAAGQMHAKDEI